MILSHSKNMNITLPANHAGAPISVIGKGEPIEVYGDGKLISRVDGFKRKTFLVQYPKWWQFWKRPRWVAR